MGQPARHALTSSALVINHSEVVLTGGHNCGRLAHNQKKLRTQSECSSTNSDYRFSYAAFIEVEAMFSLDLVDTRQRLSVAYGALCATFGLVMQARAGVTVRVGSAPMLILFECDRVMRH